MKSNGFTRLTSLGATTVVVLVFSTLAGAAAQDTIVWTDHASPFKGTKAIVPAGWTKGDDSSFNVDLFGPDYNKQTGNGGRILVLADPRATAGGKQPTKLTSVGTTPTALVAWLRHNRKLAVSAPTARTIGGKPQGHQRRYARQTDSRQRRSIVCQRLLDLLDLPHRLLPRHRRGDLGPHLFRHYRQRH